MPEEGDSATDSGLGQVGTLDLSKTHEKDSWAIASLPPWPKTKPRSTASRRGGKRKAKGRQKGCSSRRPMYTALLHAAWEPQRQQKCCRKTSGRVARASSILMHCNLVPLCNDLWGPPGSQKPAAGSCKKRQGITAASQHSAVTLWHLPCK
ncbi:hypothetical protein NDU88_001811 [Pleurodeles waltl]|uniref:Uncharacterized protein n=1 Tax=Pleurodeles waltl TaxID=8319 RepID=A0AAV7WPS7_PLEWA|nr:hypothetical protein NDU88_001811 [Pleurodeles waltl]